MATPPLFSLHKRYRARKTADGDFVEKTTVVDGKKVLGLDSKRGRAEVSDKTISILEKRIWKRIKDEKMKKLKVQTLIPRCFRLQYSQTGNSGKERSFSFQKANFAGKSGELVCSETASEQ